MSPCSRQTCLLIKSNKKSHENTVELLPEMLDETRRKERTQMRALMTNVIK